jgi:hypothetical protein
VLADNYFSGLVFCAPVGLSNAEGECADDEHSRKGITPVMPDNNSPTKTKSNQKSDV